MFCFAGIAGGVVVSGSPIPPSAEGDTTSYNRMLGRGINLGNTLDAPFEGAWGVTLKSDYFQAIADAGFNSVRIPIRWSAHALNDPPYTIDGTFFQRVDWTIDQALTRNLKVVIDLHHYGEMNQDPTANRARLLSLWRQIAVRYRDRPQSLYFELFNEPQDKFTDQDWNDVLAQLLKEVREYDSKRAIIVGPGYWNGFDHLPELQLPSDDRRLIVTFHYYRPFQFTHQAQAWLPASQAWRGTHWGNEQDKRALHDDFVSVAAWAKEHQRPIYLGEFGASENAEMDDRLAWTRAVVANANTMGFSWSYWQFTTSFGAYDTITNSWNERMLHALLN
jgi:endoglucanase